MDVSSIRMLFGYNYWANRKIMEASARLDTEQLVAPCGASLGSLFGTLVHLLDSEYGWHMLLEKGTTEAFDQINTQGFHDLKALELRWDQEERSLREYLARLRDSDLLSHVQYAGDNGQIRDRILWQCMVHVVNHGTHHRSQAAAILKGYGCAPIALDMTLFLNEMKQ
jgi:uncharacterized damage-inducible protein DinB